MPAQKFASRLLLDDLQNGAFINEGILRATPFPLPFFFPPSFNRLSLTDTLFTPLRPPPHDHPFQGSYFPLSNVFRTFHSIPDKLLTCLVLE